MPGTAMHHMIVERIMGLINQNKCLGDVSPEDYQKIQDLLSKPENLPYLYLGAQGPDFLFFNTRDWAPQIGNLADLYFEVSDFITDFKKKLEALVPQPILDLLAAFSELGDQVVESSSTLTEIQQLFSNINDILSGLVSIVEEAVKKFITDPLNPFDKILTHPYRDGVAADNPDEWWWFDVLHYRKTGQYAKALLDATSALTSPNHLYALGYLSHVGADTVGHAYVNINSGGPYRAQPQRHRTGENFQDVFNYSLSASAPLKDLNRSQLHALYNFNYTGDISAIGADTEIPDPDSKLPADLAKLIADSINGIYQVDEGGRAGTDFGPPLTADDIQASYRFWYRWWRNTTESSTIPKPVPYSFSGELREIWEQTSENLGDIGDWLDDAIDNASDFGIFAILAILGALAVAAVASALALVDAVLGAITTITVAGIRAAACLIYEQVYNAYTLFRLGVALNGLAYPMTEHNNEPVFRQFTDPSQPDATGANAAQLGEFMPLLRWTAKEAEDFPEKHLVYPPTRVSPDTSTRHGEKRAAMAAPSSYFDKHSSWYGWGDIPLDASVIDRLAALQNIEPEDVVDANGQPSDHEAETAIILGPGRRHLGNGVTLTGELYNRWRSGRPLPDFNLDSDRGYGYLCWAQLDDEGDPNTPSRIVVQPGDGASDAQVVEALEAEVKLRYLPAGA